MKCRLHIGPGLLSASTVWNGPGTIRYGARCLVDGDDRVHACQLDRPDVVRSPSALRACRRGARRRARRARAGRTVESGRARWRRRPRSTSARRDEHDRADGVPWALLLGSPTEHDVSQWPRRPSPALPATTRAVELSTTTSMPPSSSMSPTAEPRETADVVAPAGAAHVLETCALQVSQQQRPLCVVVFQGSASTPG